MSSSTDEHRAPGPDAAPRVAICGHVTHDRYGGRTVAGGCAYYGAAVYHGMGARVHLITAWGTDFVCGDAVREFERVDQRVGPMTTTFVNTYRADATRFQELPMQALPLEPEALSEVRADVLHLAPVLDEIALDRFMPVVRAARAAGRVRLVALSVQGFARAKREMPSGGHVIDHVAWRPEPGLLSGIDYAFLSQEDLIGQDDLLDRLRAAVARVVLTRGAHGAMVYGGPEVIGAVGVYATQAVDPTGAGDCFAAAYMASRARGLGDVEAARMASAAGSIVVEAEGPARLPVLAEVLERVPGVPIMNTVS